MLTRRKVEQKQLRNSIFLISHLLRTIFTDALQVVVLFIWTLELFRNYVIIRDRLASGENILTIEGHSLDSSRKKNEEIVTHNKIR